MVDELDIHNELPFSPGEGWMEMEALLNKNLPVHKKTGAIGLLRSFLPAVLFTGVLLFLSLQLDTNVKHSRFTENTLQVSATESSPSAAIPSFATQRKNYSTTKRWSNNIVTAKNKNAVVAGDHKNDFETTNAFDAVATNRILEKISTENIIKAVAENKSRGNIIKSISMNAQSNFPVKTVAGGKDPYKRSWELAGGIGVNMAAGKRQDLQPYPVAEVKYNLDPHVFVAAGLSLFSPVPGSVSGIRKTVYLNDTVNNIRLYNEQVSYDHFRYADIPVFVGVHISKKVFFQAGLQASVLLNKREKKSLQPYDFQMNNINVAVNPSMVGMAANPQQEFDVRLRNIDYRFIAGIKYRQNKMTGGLFYQHGLQSRGVGSNTSKNKTQLFTVSLLYQIK